MKWIGFKRLLTPPVFADEEKMRAARLLHIILLVAAGLTVLLTIIGIPVLLAATDPLPGFVVLCLLTLPTVIAWLLLRRGEVHLASLIFISILWLTIIATIPFSGGMNSSSFTGVIVVILMSGLLLGGRAALGLA